jgi:hypothetical protein
MYARIKDADPSQFHFFIMQRREDQRGIDSNGRRFASAVAKFVYTAGFY